ncbi:MAG: TonB-dependent receptor, partial [Chlorobi bacterium]|nr:TonB-dependent receptor [Chlorobiota bacterium]
TYTYSKSTRQFNSISFGEIYPFKYDRRHDLSFVITHKFNKKIDAGLTWVFGTGYPFTTTSSKYISAMMLNNFNNYLEGGILQRFYEIEYFRSRNNFRMPAYHRLDLSINFHKKKKSSERTFSIGVFNLYSRLNAFYITESFGKLYKYSLFPIIPSVNYSIHFK